ETRGTRELGPSWVNGGEMTERGPVLSLALSSGGAAGPAGARHASEPEPRDRGSSAGVGQKFGSTLCSAAVILACSVVQNGFLLTWSRRDAPLDSFLMMGLVPGMNASWGRRYR